MEALESNFKLWWLPAWRPHFLKALIQSLVFDKTRKCKILAYYAFSFYFSKNLSYTNTTKLSLKFNINGYHLLEEGISCLIFKVEKIIGFIEEATVKWDGKVFFGIWLHKICQWTINTCIYVLD